MENNSPNSRSLLGMAWLAFLSCWNISNYIHTYCNIITIIIFKRVAGVCYYNMARHLRKTFSMTQNQKCYPQRRAASCIGLWSCKLMHILNDRCELHGSCCHTARFHRLFMRSGTDDSEWDESVVLCFGISSSQATGCGLGPTSSCRVIALDAGPKKWLDEWPQHLTTWGTGFWSNSSSATLYGFFLIN
jgi:hypothetical protein